jgi:hypothetical protein
MTAPKLERENSIVEAAIESLRKMDIQHASEDKKISFLKSKGLSDTQVQEVLQTVQNPVLPSLAPSRTAETITIRNWWKIVKNIVFATGVLGISGIFLVRYIKDWLIQVYNPFLKLYQLQVRHRLVATRSYFEHALEFCGLYKSVQSCEENEQSVSKAFKTMNYTIAKNFAKAIARTKEVCEANDKDLKELSEQTRELSTFVRQHLYFPVFGVSDATSAIRSDIRSLKGIFLSRRNFPSVQEWKQRNASYA